LLPLDGLKMKNISLYKLGVVLDVQGAEPALAKLQSVDRQSGRVASNFKVLEGLNWPSALMTGASAAAGLTTALFGLAKEASDYGSAIFDASQKTGLTTETLSALKFAADQSGSSFEEISGVIPKFERAIFGAATGNKEFAATFKALGVDVREGVKDVDAALAKFLKGFQGIKSDVERAAVAQQLFGRSGANLIPTFNTVGASLDDYKRQVGELGLLLSEKAAREADEFGDQLDELTAQGKGAAMIFGRAVIPEFTAGLRSLNASLGENRSEFQVWAGDVAAALRGVRRVAESEVGSTIGWLAKMGFHLSPVGMVYDSLKRVGGPPEPPTPDAFSYADPSNRFRQNKSTSTDSGLIDEINKTEKAARSTKKHADALAAYRGIQQRASLALQFFGDRSEVASVKQSFLSAGIEKLTGKLRAQAEELQRLALADAALLDGRRAEAEATAKAKSIQEQFNSVLTQQRERLIDLEGGEDEIQRINRLLSDPEVAKSVDERTRGLVRLNAALIVGRENINNLNQKFAGLNSSLQDQARSLRQQLALSGVTNPADRLQIQFDTDPLPKGMTGEQMAQLIHQRRELVNLTRQLFQIEQAQAADASYRQLLDELNGKQMLSVSLTEYERVSRLLLTDAYAGLTAAQKESLLVKAREIDLQDRQIEQLSLMPQLLEAIRQSASMLPGGGQTGGKRGFFSKLLGFAAPFLNFIPGVGPLLSTLATVGSNALAGNWAGVVTGVARAASARRWARRWAAHYPARSRVANTAAPSTAGARTSLASGGRRSLRLMKTAGFIPVWGRTAAARAAGGWAR
jgi:hypothetical protein